MGLGCMEDGRRRERDRVSLESVCAVVVGGSRVDSSEDLVGVKAVDRSRVSGRSGLVVGVAEVGERRIALGEAMPLDLLNWRED